MTSIELIEKINTVTKDRVFYLDEYDAYIVCVNGFRGVAIECDDNIEILEKFNKVAIQNVEIDIKNNIVKMVLLYTKESKMSKNYGLLCLDFLSFDNRNLIKNNPMEWFENWRDLLGNTKTNKMIFDVIGEMKVLLLLQKQGLEPVWDSSNLGTFDITTRNGVYEVKSTIKRTHSYITIHNQFQLNYEELDSNLYIAFVRLEQNDSGESIDDLYNQLIFNGFDKDILDNYLTQLGYYNGKQERYVKYITHNIDRYLVDEKFPRITNLSFKQDEIPQGIIKYEYTISLDNLDKTSLI